jgi:hypothetical protein
MRKNTLFLILWFVGSYITKAQTNETLQTEVEKIYEASYVLDYDAILNYTHPKLFDFISREQMTTVMQSMFENEAFQIRFVHPKVAFTYGNIQTIEGNSYCVIQYNNAMRMTFDKKMNGTKVTEIRSDLLESKEYEKVTFEKERNSFFIEGKSILIGVKGEGTQNQWRFVNYSSSQAQLVTMILGDDIIKSLGL